MTESQPRRLAYAALLGFTVLVAAVTFVLSFSGLDDYGSRVAKLGVLSPLVPIGVDGLTLCAVAATFLLRHARFRVRLYAWSVFAIAIASSVAGNLSHAAANHLSADGMVGAAAWPILLALASHMVIVVRRNMEITSDPESPVVQAEVSEPDQPGQVDKLSSPGTAPRKPQPSSRERVEKAHRRTPDATHAELAGRLNLSAKTVQRWRPPKPAEAGQVNGHQPELEMVPAQGGRGGEE